MQGLREHIGVADTCAQCGGDPGGLIWEGIVLKGILTQFDVERLLNGALDHRQVVRLFTTKRLQGTKAGRVWVIRASQFITDWDRFERMGRVPVGRKLAIRRAEKNVIEVVAR